MYGEYTENDMIAFCGVDCTACPDYMSRECSGCRQIEWKEGDECLPVGCCREKGISSCGECPVFPCEDMKEFYKESESHEKAYSLMLSCRNGKSILEEAL